MRPGPWNSPSRDASLEQGKAQPTAEIPPVQPFSLVGRDGELARLALGLSRLSVVMIFGHAGVGKSALAAVVRETAGVGAMALCQNIESDRVWDPFPVGDPDAIQETTQGTQAHSKAIRCLQLLRQHRPQEADELLARTEPLVGQRPGSGYDRCLVHVLGAVPSGWRTGKEPLAAELARAREVAAEEGADEDFVDVALRWIRGDLGGLTRVQDPAPEPEGAHARWDRDAMVLRVGEHRIDLARRPVLQRLFDTLARQCDQVVSVDELVLSVWEVEYHPLRHDNTLRVNVRRLRNLLTHTGLSIETVSGGYRLLSPGEFQVEPA